MPMLMTIKLDLINLLSENISHGRINGRQYDELQRLRDAEEPFFMVDLLRMYIEDNEDRIEDIHDHLLPHEKFRAITRIVRKIKDSSLTVGIEKVTKACNEYLEAFEQSSKDGCQRALAQLKTEFELVKPELEEIIELEREIVILSTPPQD